MIQFKGSILVIPVKDEDEPTTLFYRRFLYKGFIQVVYELQLNHLSFAKQQWEMIQDKAKLNTTI
jgi:hypothetical protein